MVMSNKAKFTKDQRRARITGGVGAEPSFWRISWTALTLEDVGKSPTDGGATWKAAARGTSVRDLRVRFVVEP
jgi:hypothetical protein